MSKTVLITGSATGIGAELARSFAEAKHNIFLHGLLEPSEVTPLHEELTSLGAASVHYIKEDISTHDGCKNLIRAVVEEAGGLHILVNNAGIQHTQNVENFSLQAWQDIMNVNLSACFYLAQSAIPFFKEAGWGRMIHMASVHGLVASVKKSAYVAAKHGLIGLSKVLALELAGQGITSNTICPGWVLTPMVHKQIQDIAQDKNISLDDARKHLLQEKQPSGEFVNARALGALALFLCSDHGNQITGSSLTVDGGWTCQ